ncbi:unnamed protein product [Caenorhabditis bovis]|uniref:BSD domain-containing protein n=1 Tax=Caenorhabditis bovis TaxID=2654633 RepID=A0A8S1F958_9PELO|nr:unnamed protein product [Caenorhabditis bovis]
MSWLLADFKKRMNDAKSTIEQSFKEAANYGVASTEENSDVVENPKEQKIEETVTSDESGGMKQSMSSLFGGLKVSGGVASTKLFEYAKDATKKLENVKNAVIENSLLADLNKEQTEFEKQLQTEREKTQGVELPWHGLPDEELAKKQMLSLSTDTRNFLRDSPANSEYSYDQQQAMATILLETDPNLANVRFQLVPKQIKENKFWQNYFYRIGLIRQSMMAQEAPKKVVEAEEQQSKVEEKAEEKSCAKVVAEETSSSSEPEKIDETEKLEETTTTEQPDGGEATLTSVDEEWEREILADLNDYEDVVEKTGGKDEEAWEAEMQNLLMD